MLSLKYDLHLPNCKTQVIVNNNIKKKFPWKTHISEIFLFLYFIIKKLKVFKRLIYHYCYHQNCNHHQPNHTYLHRFCWHENHAFEKDMPGCRREGVFVLQYLLHEDTIVTNCWFILFNINKLKLQLDTTVCIGNSHCYHNHEC